MYAAKCVTWCKLYMGLLNATHTAGLAYMRVCSCHMYPLQRGAQCPASAVTGSFVEWSTSGMTLDGSNQHITTVQLSCYSNRSSCILLCPQCNPAASPLDHVPNLMFIIAVRVLPCTPHPTLFLPFPPPAPPPHPPSQAIALSPLADSYLGASGTDLLNIAGAGALAAGISVQLYVAATNYAKWAPEGYNAVADVKVRRGCEETRVYL